MTSYRAYVADARFMRDYAEYQQRYAVQVRESDKVLIGLVEALAAERSGPTRVLDVGCSTGNLLLHLKRSAQNLELVGADMAEEVLEACRSNADLAGVEFRALDLLRLGLEPEFDIVIANAVVYLFGDDEFAEAARSVASALRPGGSFLAFDFFHPFEQSLRITERERTHPDGLTLHFRPFSETQRMLRESGFATVEFHPFEIPIELPRPAHDDEIVSYTRRAADGANLLFRGTLFQPWCHLVATVPG